MSKSDILILILLIIISAGILFAFLYFNDTAGSIITIEAKGEIVGRIPLEKYDNSSKTYHIEGEIGVSKILVEDGRVRMIESPCPNKVCVNTYWIENPGELIACIPNKIIIRIEE